MPCYDLQTCYQHEKWKYVKGAPKPVFTISKDRIRELGAAGYIPMQVPCGRCIGCRLDYSKDWAVRGYHESTLHLQNSFITLTFAPEHYPVDGSVNVRDMQLFFKAYRNEIYPKRIRYMCCGEYGDQTKRAHYHAIVFGHTFDDLQFYKRTGGNNLYTSKKLEEIWKYGQCTVGEADFKTIAYVARYITKKINGQLADSHYMSIDKDSGEYFGQLHKEFFTCSRNPGIGLGWLDLYWRDLNADYVSILGDKYRIPRFYFDKMVERGLVDNMAVKTRRQSLAQAHAEDNTPARRAVRKRVHELKARKLVRSFETKNEVIL